jgi:hypothetical protein
MDSISTQNFYLKEIQTEDYEIPIENCCYQKEILEVFTCFICLNIANNPRTCLKCEGVACRMCIEKAYKPKFLCPKGCGRKYESRELTIIERSILNAISISCLLGCETTFRYEFLKQHLNNCQNVIRVAICNGCKVEVLTNCLLVEINQHINACPEINVNCLYCNKPVKRRLLVNHEDNCEYNFTQCEDCGFTCKKIELKRHNKKSCMKILKDDFDKKMKEADILYVNKYKEIENVINKKKEDDLNMLKNNFNEKIKYLEGLIIELKDELKRKELMLKEKTFKINNTIPVEPKPDQESAQDLIKLEKIKLTEVKQEEFNQDAKLNKKFRKEKVIDAHLDSVYCLIQLSDGNIASGSFDSSIKVWDGKDLTHLYTLEGHLSSVFCLIQISSGQLVSGSYDNTIKIWFDKQCEATLESHTQPVECLLELPNGYLASGSWDKTIKIWDQDFKCYCIIKGHQDTITTMINLDEDHLATGSCDSTIRVWSNFMGVYNQLYTLSGHTSAVRCLIKLKNGKLASCSWDKTIKIWKGREIIQNMYFAHNDYITKIIELSNGKILSASYDKTMKIWKKKKAESVIKANTSINCLVQLVDGRLLTGSKDGMITVWDYNFE